MQIVNAKRADFSPFRILEPALLEQNTVYMNSISERPRFCKLVARAAKAGLEPLDTAGQTCVVARC